MANDPGETVIGKSIVIEGEICGGSALVVLGTVKGTVKCGESVQVEPSGVVEADIETKRVVVMGMVVGKVVAKESIEIKPGGQLLGDVRSSRIMIADGAVYRGNVDMEVKG